MTNLLNNKEMHIEHHNRLHISLDELVADFITHTGKLPSQTTIMELIQWSYKQTTNPSVKEGEEEK